MRVAAGAIARKYLLQHYGVEIVGYLSRIGPIKAEQICWEAIDSNPFFCPDPDKVDQIAELIETLRREGDSIGARIDIIARNVPVGLGEPVFDKLDADIAKALMSINAVKGVEIGAGFAVAGMKGSENRDEITPQQGFLSNHAGGILGGISSGQQIHASIALKPTSSIRIPGRSIDVQGSAQEVVTKGRHDPCVGIRATPIAEAMMALVLMDHVLRDRAQNAISESRKSLSV